MTVTNRTEIQSLKAKFPLLTDSVIQNLVHTTYNQNTGNFELRDSSLTKVKMISKVNVFNSTYKKYFKTMDSNGKVVYTLPSDIFWDFDNTEIFIKYSNSRYLRQSKKMFSFEDGVWETNPWVRPDLGTESEDCGLFFELISHILGDTTDTSGIRLTEHFYDWASFLLCHNGTGPNWHWIIESSVKGNGKSSMARLIGSILGSSNTLRADGAMLTSSFYSGEFCNKELIELDELGTNMNLSEKKHILDSLKSVAASEWFDSTSKGKMSVKVPRTFGMFATTNDVTGLCLESGDRRWVVHSTDVAPKSLEFYDRLSKDLDNNKKLKAFSDFLTKRFNNDRDRIIRACLQIAPKTNSKEVLTIQSKSTAEIAVETAIADCSFGSTLGFTSVDCTEPFFSLASVSDEGFRDGRELSISDFVRKVSQVAIKKGYVLMEIDNGNANKSMFSQHIVRRCIFAVNRSFYNQVCNSINLENKNDSKSQNAKKEWEGKVRAALKDHVRMTYLNLYLSKNNGIKDNVYTKLLQIVDQKNTVTITAQKDDKDMLIERLKKEIETLKEDLKNLNNPVVSDVTPVILESKQTPKKQTTKSYAFSEHVKHYSKEREVGIFFCESIPFQDSPINDEEPPVPDYVGEFLPDLGTIECY